MLRAVHINLKDHNIPISLPTYKNTTISYSLILSVHTIPRHFSTLYIIILHYNLIKTLFSHADFSKMKYQISHK